MLVNLYLNDRSRKRNYTSVLALSCNFPQEKACEVVFEFVKILFTKTHPKLGKIR